VTDPVLASSFRDPSGFVFARDGRLYRQVNQEFREHYDLMMGSGLYEALVRDGLMVAHEEVDVEPATAEAYRILRPELVPFISYPYEWCFGQLKDAALATLRLQRQALEHGMSLRDASAYNLQFAGGRPVLIDTLSFERLREGEPWVAYRQFCQHFLAPLALMAHCDVRLGQLSRIHMDGVPLDLAASLLPRRVRSRPGLLMHLVMHAKSQARHASDRENPEAKKGRAFGARAFQGLLDSLDSAVQKLTWEPEKSVWAEYYGECESYMPDALEHKKELVDGVLDRVEPKTVWDLGGNTGLFSRLCSSRGAHAVCFDADHSAVELNYRACVGEGEGGVLPLVMDLANPSPALGWGSEERMSLEQRGPADLALALALIHHLAIGNNVPLERIGAWFRRLTAWLAIEFVPKSDPEVQTLLASREDIFPLYTPEGFEEAFARHFAIEDQWDVKGSERTLYLMRGR
jgi:ribosomal protein L11 methylase PrmA